MQCERNCQKRIWLLTGTGEGPPFAESLLNQGYKVSVSVVTCEAAFSYSHMPLENLLIGQVGNVIEIEKFLRQIKLKNGGFDCVIDLTHPFASRISRDLLAACNKSGVEYIRYERPIEKHSEGSFLSSLDQISSFDMTGERILMAIGARELSVAVEIVKAAGAEVFARVLPNPKSLKTALNSSLLSEHIAVIKPLLGSDIGIYESALCKKWGVTGILCRQSGGRTEKMWRRISTDMRLKLWLIRRPESLIGITKFTSLKEILFKLSKIA